MIDLCMFVSDISLEWLSFHDTQNYDGDVSDLCLTFSWEEELMGKTVTHDLKPGGSSIAVTNENR